MSSAPAMSNAFKIEPAKRSEKETMELPKWVNKLIVTHLLVIISSASGIGWLLAEMRADLSFTRQRLTSIEQTLAAQIDDRYRARDAERDFRVRDETINRMHMRISELERKLNAAK